MPRLTPRPRPRANKAPRPGRPYRRWLPADPARADGQLGLSGEQARAASREALAERPAVTAKLDEAAAQARDYGATLRKRHGLQALHAFAVVALGFERLVWRRL